MKKKLTGFLGIAVIAVAAFLATNGMNNSNGDFVMSDLLSLNTANAECGPAPSCSSVCYTSSYFYCTMTCEMNYLTCANSYPR